MTLPVFADPDDLARAQARLKNAILDPPKDQAEVLKDILGTLFGVRIIWIAKSNIVKSSKEKSAVYSMGTEEGAIPLVLQLQKCGEEFQAASVMAAPGRCLVPPSPPGPPQH